jgi:ABC-2 type transport system permease protein
LSKLFAIVQREFIERVRTKAFLIGTLMAPLIFAAVGFIPQLMMGKATRTQSIAVIDATAGQIAGRLVDSLSRERLTTGEGELARYELRMIPADPSRAGSVRDSILPEVDQRDERGDAVPGSLTGILIVTDTGLAAGRLGYLGRNVGSIGDISHLERVLRSAVVRERIVAAGGSMDLARVATQRVDLTTAKVTKGRVTGEKGESAFWLSYILIIVLFIALLPTGVQVMSAVVEEKTNRILEVLVSSVKPFDLMLGKVLGVGAAVLLQLGIWGASAAFLGVGGGGGLGGGGPQAAQGAGEMSMSLPTIPTDLILVTLAYFALGFLFYATAYAAVGAMCNTVQETQQASFPVMGMLLAGYLGAFATIGRPESMAAKVMTFLPPTAPFIVPTRWSNSPLPLTELLASIAVCFLGVLGMVWLAARIYRIGILSYGKKPSFKDVWRWIRAA